MIKAIVTIIILVPLLVMLVLSMIKTDQADLNVESAQFDREYSHNLATFHSGNKKEQQYWQEQEKIADIKLKERQQILVKAQNKEAKKDDKINQLIEENLLKHAEPDKIKPEPAK